MKSALNGITPFILAVTTTEGSYFVTNPKVRFVEDIRSELSAITQKIEGFETQLTQKDEIEAAAQIVNDWGEIHQVIKEIRGVQRQLSDQQNRIDNLQDELTSKQNARLEKQNNLEKKYTPDHQKIEATLGKINEALKTNREKLADSKQQSDLIKSELDLDRRQSEIETQQKERQQQLEEVEQIETKHHLWNELNEVIPRLETIVSILIRSHDDAIAVSKSQQTLEKELKSLEKRRIKFAQLKKQSKALNNQLHAAEKLEEDIYRQQKADEDLLDKREEAHGKSLCPTCGTSLEGKELDRIHHELLELRKKVKSGKALLKDARQNTTQIKEQAEKAKKQYTHEERDIDREASRLSAEQEIVKSRNDHAKKQEKDALKKWELLKSKINYSAQLVIDPTKICLEIAQKEQKALKDIQRRYTQLMRTQAEFNAAQTELENILGQRQCPVGTYSQAQLKEVNSKVSGFEDAIKRDDQTLEIKKEEERKLYQLLTKTENEVNGLVGRIQDIEQKLLPKEIEIYKEVEHQQEEILERFEKRLSELDWPAQYLKGLRRSIDKDQKAEQRLGDWIKSHRPLSNQLSESQAAEKEIGGLRSRYITLDERIKGFPEDVQQGNSKAIEKSLEANRKELDEKGSEHEHWKRTVWEETKRLSQKVCGEEKLIRLSEEEKSFRELAILLEPPGPRSAGGPLLQEIMRDALKKVAKKASDILDEWNQSTQIVVPQDALGFKVVDLTSGNTERHFQLFSGGEKFMVALAMALAIGEVASDTGHTDCLFIDEGFGLLDKENRAYVTQEIVNKLVSGGRRKQVIVITHMEDIKDVFPDRRSRYHLVNDGNATQLVVGDDDDSS
ncbi:MAG TPA: SMC family ATPase [Thermodesulfobacteriota bacterium]